MEKLQPKLRFPEFKEKWREIELQNVTDKIGDGLHGTPIYDDSSDINFINGNNLGNGEINFFPTTKKVSFDIFSKNDKKLNSNSILISINGTIGSVARYKGEKVMLGKSVAYLNFNEDSGFYFQILNSEKIQKYFESELTGSTIKNLSLKTLRETSLFVPTSNLEQTKIATFLSAVDEKLNLLKEKKALLEEYKKGMMQKIFSQELRFKDENGKDFADWEEKSLGSVATFLKGKGLPKNDIIAEGQFKCIHYGELFTKYNEFIKKIISYTDNNEKSILSITNDILMPTSDVTPNGLATASCIKQDGVILGGDILIIRQNKKLIDGHFFAYFVKQFREKVMKLVSGSTVYHLYGSDMAKLEIVIPQIEEQDKIVGFLSAIDEKIELVTQQIEDTQEYKKGLLQQMFC